MDKEVTGKCLCEKIVVHVQNVENGVIACHCGMCRKQAGGPLFFTNEIASDKYSFEEGSPVKVYKSSEFAERGFCSECGTFLFWRKKDDQHASFNIELFPEIIRKAQFNAEIYTEDKPDYYSFAK